LAIISGSGKPSSETALKAASVEIETFELVQWVPPELEFRVICSPGTYVRSLARDVGRALRTGGHLTRLRRTQSGPFVIEDAVPPGEATPENLIRPQQALAFLPSMEAGDALLDAVGHGQSVECPIRDLQDGSHLCILNKRGRLIAVATSNGGWASPKVVLL